MQIGRSLVLYRSSEHRVLELLKNLALGRVFQHFQARRVCPLTRATPRALVLSRYARHAAVSTAILSQYLL